MICGALAQIRGERLIYTLSIDLSFNRLGDGDHSSELSPLSEGIFYVFATAMPSISAVDEQRTHNKYRQRFKSQ